jgi:hypothetical protein
MQISASSRSPESQTCVGKDFRCRGVYMPGKKRSHDVKSSIALNTWFAKCNMPMEKLLMLTYLISLDHSYEDCIRKTYDWVNDISISSAPVAKYYSGAREVMMCALDQRFQSRGKIGGPGHIIEIDEMLFGRRKYECGRLGLGSWILGIIAHPSPGAEFDEFRMEICPNNERSIKALTPLIVKHVNLGTVIMTDLWRGYNDLDNHGFYRLTVNHSTHFIDPITWANTQKIESQWRYLRKCLSNGGVRRTYDENGQVIDHNLADHLCEYIWRRECRRQGLDPFVQFIKDIVAEYPGEGESDPYNLRHSTVEIESDELNLEEGNDEVFMSE